MVILGHRASSLRFFSGARGLRGVAPNSYSRGPAKLALPLGAEKRPSDLAGNRLVMPSLRDAVRKRGTTRGVALYFISAGLIP
jgi:hypothetical protein